MNIQTNPRKEDKTKIQSIYSSNKPISYDYHGSIPIDVPFQNIKPSDIALYFNLDTRVGKMTCQQSCSHCFFISEKEARNKSIDLKQALEITQCLRKKGYSVFPRTADSFTNNGEFLKIFSSSNVRNYCFGDERTATEEMEKGEIWTSGAPLLKDNWKALLKIGQDNNFGTISMTFHGILNDDLQIKPKSSYPFKNVFYGTELEEVISRIKKFNQENSQSLDHDFNYKLAFGVTIGKHNNTKRSLINYINYFNNIGANKVRFNCFHDYSRNNRNLELSSEEIKQFYKDIKWIYSNINMKYELGISEDFGNIGIEVMDFPNYVGMCRAGRQLFAIVPEKPEFIEEKNNFIVEKIGTLAGCVDAFKPIMGQLICLTDKTNGNKNYEIEFFHDVINEISQKRINGHYKNGCFGPALHKELYLEKNMPDVAAK